MYLVFQDVQVVVILWYAHCCSLHPLYFLSHATPCSLVRIPSFSLSNGLFPPSHPPPIPHCLLIFISHPDLSLPAAIGSNSPTAAAGAQAAMLGGRQVLVHGPAVWDEAQAQLEMSGQPAVCGQCQNQQRGDQEEAHHQEGHATSVSQQV